MLPVSEEFSSVASGPYNRPAASGQRPAASGQRPAASGQRPAASGQRPAASGQRPAASGQRPAASGPNCVRYSRLGSSPPDARTGRPRARRLSLLLPVLALVFGALGLFAAAPASAQDPTAPSVPRNVQVVSGNAQATITWQAPSSWGTWNAVAYELDSDVDGSFKAVRKDGQDAFVAQGDTSFVLSGVQYSTAVTNGELVTIRIRALSQRPGTVGSTQSSDFLESSWVTVTVRIGVPLTPTGLTVTPGGSALELVWTAPGQNAAAISGYDVHYTSAARTGQNSVADDAAASGSNAAAAWVAATHTGTTASATIGSLAVGRTYRVRVRAKNTHGAGPWVFGSGAPAALSAPTALKVVNGDGRLILTWTAPTETVTGYGVSYTSATEATLSNYGAYGSNAATSWVSVNRTGTTASQTITGLTIGTTYRVRVQGVNNAGNGAFVFGSGTPAKPVVTFRATATATEGGSAVIELKIAPTLATASRIFPGLSPTIPSTADVLNDVSGLSSELTLPADSETVQWTISALDDAVNEAHETLTLEFATPSSSPYSLPSNTVTLTINDNDAPTAPTLSVSGASGGLNASWTKPAGPVTLYTVHVKAESAPDQQATSTGQYPLGDPATGWAFRNAFSPSTSISIGGLNYGTTYNVRVRASDGQTGTGNGNGPWSAIKSITPVHPNLPRAPRDFRAFPNGPGELKISWQSPLFTLSGVPLGTGWSTDHELHYTSAAKSAVADDAQASGTDPSTAWVKADFRRAVITGLTNGTEYRLRGRVHNAFGPGRWAFTTGTPQAQFDATAPTVQILRPWVLNQLQLVWVDPMVGRTPAGYHVHYTSAAESAAANDAAAVSGTDPSKGWVDAKGTGSHVARIGGGGNLFSFPPEHASKFKRGTEYRFRARASYAQFTSRGVHAPNLLSNWGHTKFVVGSHTAVGLYEPQGAAGYESLGYADVRVRLAAPAAGAVTVDYATSASATRPATAGSDYTAVSGTLTFAAGETAKTLRVPIINDNESDSGERFVVTLSNPQPSDKVRLGSYVPGFTHTGLGGVLTAKATVWIFNHEADLKALAVEVAADEDGPFAALDIGAFTPETTAYAVTVPHGTTHARLTPTALHEKQRLRAGTGSNLQAVASGAASGVIALSVGDNGLVVESFISAEVQKTYTVAVHREAPPLTAAFENVPAEHDGEAAFALDVRFSEALGETANAPAAASFAVQGGKVTGVEKVEAGLWRVRIAPKSWKDMTVTLAGGRACDEPGAVCTADGQALTNTSSATIGGPVRIRIEGARAKEGKDESLDFAVTLNRAAAHEVSVDYATEDDTATAGEDYTATSGTLVFAAGETAKTISVPVLDDTVDEGKEVMRLLLSNPRGAYLRNVHKRAKGVIVNDDALQQAWLARFGRTVGGHVTDAVSGRLTDGLTPGMHATLAGQPVDLMRTGDGKALAEVMTGLAQRFGAPGGPANDDDPFARNGFGGGAGSPGSALSPSTPGAASSPAQSVTGRELLLGSSFHLSGAGDGSGPGLAGWGRAAYGSFEGEQASDTGRLRLDGEVVTGTLGADADWGRMLAGVAVSLSEGEGTFDDPGVDKGTIESTMTTVSPYARFRVSEQVMAWGLVGWGTGDMTIRFDDGSDPTRTDLSMRLGALGARGDLLKQDGPRGMDLALKADAMFVTTEAEKAANSAATSADASRLRLVLEGGRSFVLSGATFRPGLEVGVRQDGGDAETGTGVELGGGVAWADPSSGLSLEAKARILVAHADSDYEEWGASATVRLDPAERGRGLSFSLAPTVGATSSASERLWGAQDARALAPGSEFDAARGLQGEMGYGMALLGDRFTGTPNVGFGMSDTAREYRMGWRLTSADPGDPGFEIGLDATRREAANDNAPEHGVMLKSLMRW